MLHISVLGKSTELHGHYHIVSCGSGKHGAEQVNRFLPLKFAYNTQQKSPWHEDNEISLERVNCELPETGQMLAHVTGA